MITDEVLTISAMANATQEPAEQNGLETFLIVLLSLMIIITIVGNILVCLSVVLVRKLRSPSNYLLVSLAISDLGVAILVMPLALNLEVKGYWDLGPTLCDMWVSFDVTSCAASILNLCMISVDRYLTITRPLTYGVKRTTKRMFIFIGTVWILSILVSIPPLLVIGNEHGTAEEPQCIISKNIGYQLYATFASFYIPLAVMIILYYKIYNAAKSVVDAEMRSLGINQHRYVPTFKPLLRQANPPATAKVEACSLPENCEIVKNMSNHVIHNNNNLHLHSRHQIQHANSNHNQQAPQRPSQPLHHSNNAFCKAHLPTGEIIKLDCVESISETMTTAGWSVIDSSYLKANQSDQQIATTATSNRNGIICGSTAVGHSYPPHAHHYHRSPTSLHASSNDRSVDGKDSCTISLQSSLISSYKRLKESVLPSATRAPSSGRSTKCKAICSIDEPARNLPDSVDQGDRGLHLRVHHNHQNRQTSSASLVDKNHGLGPSEKRRTSSMLKERKASITLGVIMTAFTACWLPFFILALLRPFDIQISRSVSSFAYWLGLANSMLNPIIYVTFHHDFRKAFRYLLGFQCASMDGRLRQRAYQSQYGASPRQTMSSEKKLLHAKPPESNYLCSEENAWNQETQCDANCDQFLDNLTSSKHTSL